MDVDALIISIPCLCRHLDYVNARTMSISCSCRHRSCRNPTYVNILRKNKLVLMIITAISSASDEPLENLMVCRHSRDSHHQVVVTRTLNPRQSYISKLQQSRREQNSSPSSMSSLPHLPAKTTPFALRPPEIDATRRSGRRLASQNRRRRFLVRHRLEPTGAFQSIAIARNGLENGRCAQLTTVAVD